MAERTFGTVYDTKEKIEYHQKRQDEEVAANRKIFNKLLPELLKKHRNEYALMRDGKIIGIFKDSCDAYAAGGKLFDEDFIFTIQIITDRPFRVGTLYQV